MTTYWQAGEKEIVEVEIIRHTDANGRVCISAVIPRMVAKPILCFPHYEVPRPLRNEDGSVKPLRVVTKTW